MKKDKNIGDMKEFENEKPYFQPCFPQHYAIFSQRKVKKCAVLNIETKERKLIMIIDFFLRCQTRK